MRKLAELWAVVLPMMIGTAAAAPVPKEIARAPGKLDGTWRLVKRESGGEKVMVGWLAGGVTWEVKGGSLGIGHHTSAEQNFVGTIWSAYTLTTDIPDELDFAPARETTGRPRLGRYDLDGDTLTVCHAAPGATRPAKLKSGDGVEWLVFERAKPAAKPGVQQLLGGAVR